MHPFDPSFESQRRVQLYHGHCGKFNDRAIEAFPSFHPYDKSKDIEIRRESRISSSTPSRSR